jgi:hypothetical protein
VDVAIDAIGGRLFRRLWRKFIGRPLRPVWIRGGVGERGVATAARSFAMGLFSPYVDSSKGRTLIGFNLRFF